MSGSSSKGWWNGCGDEKEHEIMGRWVEWEWKPVSEWASRAYNISHFALALGYVVLLVYMTVCFMRYRYHSRFFTTSFGVGATIRMLFFFISPLVEEEVLRIAAALSFMLNTLPSVMLLSTYVSVIFFWGKLYQSEVPVGALARETNWPALAVNVAMYAVVAVLYSLDFAYNPRMRANHIAKPHTPFEEATQFFVGGMYVCVSVGFFVFCFFTYRRLWRQNYGQQPHRADHRRKLLNRVGTATLIAMSAFIVRAGITTWSVFDDISVFWWVDPLYYTCLELAPMALILNAYLRKRNEELPPDALYVIADPHHHHGSAASSVITTHGSLVSAHSPLIQGRRF